jgi:putrescine carbamoyltransferase
MTRDFNDINDFTVAELSALMKLTGLLKEADRVGCVPELLKDRSLGMIFEEPSTRTRVSFEVAMVKLGGHDRVRPGREPAAHAGGAADLVRVPDRVPTVAAEG